MRGKRERWRGAHNAKVHANVSYVVDPLPAAIESLEDTFPEVHEHDSGHEDCESHGENRPRPEHGVTIVAFGTAHGKLVEGVAGVACAAKCTIVTFAAILRHTRVILARVQS